MVNSVKFALLDSKQLRSVAGVNRLIDALERLAGIQEVHTSARHRRIFISFNGALIDETTLGEKLAEWGYAVRPLD